MARSISRSTRVIRGGCFKTGVAESTLVQCLLASQEVRLALQPAVEAAEKATKRTVVLCLGTSPGLASLEGSSWQTRAPGTEDATLTPRTSPETSGSGEAPPDSVTRADPLPASAYVSVSRFEAAAEHWLVRSCVDDLCTPGLRSAARLLVPLTVIYARLVDHEP